MENKTEPGDTGKVCTKCGKVIQFGEQYFRDNDERYVHINPFTGSGCMTLGKEWMAQPLQQMQPPMSLRAYIATAALQGLLQHGKCMEEVADDLLTDTELEGYSMNAVALADALIKELAR